MRRVLTFGTELFWGVVWVFLILAVGRFVLGAIQSHVGGFIGTVANDVETAAGVVS
jgi:hypothetical protein